MTNARRAPRLSGENRQAVTAANLLERLDLEQADFANRLSANSGRRSDLGQFFTPIEVARFMASMLELRGSP